MNTQAQVIAEIVLALPEKPTGLDILKAVNEAFSRGMQFGLTFPVKPIEGFDDRA